MPASRPSRLRLETQGGVTIVSFADAVIVDDLVLNEVRDDLYGLVDAQKKPHLVLNLGNVRKYSTQLLGHLLGLKKKVMKAGGELRLCAIAPNLMDAVRILHLEKVFDIHEEEQDAVDSFR